MFEIIYQNETDYQQPINYSATLDQIGEITYYIIIEK